MNSGTHSLRTLFQDLVERYYQQGVGLYEPALHQYVAEMLTDFCRTEQLFKLRDAAGKPLQDVGEMLLESDPVYGPAPSFDREREVRKHIGDYTLFFAGMFPESLNRWRLRRQRLESFIDFMKAGRESYAIVSKFDQFEYAEAAPLFKLLSAEFERCVYGLNMVKTELDELQHPIARRPPELLM